MTALNAKIFWKCRVWMIILFILFFIAAVIFISLVLCSGSYSVDNFYRVKGAGEGV